MKNDMIFGNVSYRYENVLAAVSAMTKPLSDLHEVATAVSSLVGAFSDTGRDLDRRACQLWKDSLKLLARMMEPYYSLDPLTDAVHESERASLFAIREFALKQLEFHLELVSQLTRALATPGSTDCNTVPCLENLATGIVELAHLAEEVECALTEFDDNVNFRGSDVAPVLVES